MKNTLIKTVCLILILSFSLVPLTACGENPDIYTAEITIKNYGTVKIELDHKSAPVTVKNFVTLARSGFYDGLTFHRIVKGFMIQGGAPDITSSVYPDNNPGEFLANGFDNRISHTRGVISMARAGSGFGDDEYGYNTASSQFFICTADSEFLDGNYAAFGWVTEGMRIIDRVVNDYIDNTDRSEDNLFYGYEGGSIQISSMRPVIEKIVIKGGQNLDKAEEQIED